MTAFITTTRENRYPFQTFTQDEGEHTHSEKQNHDNGFELIQQKIM